MQLGLGLLLASCAVGIFPNTDIAELTLQRMLVWANGGTWKIDPDQRPVCTAVPEAIAAGFEQLQFSYSQMIPELPPILQGDWEYILMANQFVAFPSRWSDNANNSLKLH